MTDSSGVAASAPSPLLPAALHTFLIADVRGYTRFTVEHGDAAAARLAEQFATIATAVAAAHAGEVIELRGDEALAVFASARQALHAALDLQQRCAQQVAADPSLPLRIGIGLDAGEAVPVGSGYRGGALNRAARLCSLAQAGEVLCSQAVMHLAGTTEGVALVERGDVVLKGLDRPLSVLQLFPADAVPLGTLPPLPGQQLPRGTVTFLYTDIEGSTNLWQQQPEVMPRALERHDGLIREAVEASGGVIFRRMGDAVCAAFPAAPPALAAAAAAQRALAAEPWDEGCVLRVRMAVHTGAAEVREGDYVGHTLNRVARLLTAGHGGQILLSAETKELVGAALPADSELLDLGEHRLKDLTTLEQIFQLSVAALPQVFPPLITAGGQATNLPLQPTPFIGRERELEAVTRLLADPTVRLLTLTGAGGTGKTRLALEAAATRLPFMRDGAFAAFLAPLANPTLVPSTIAEALGVKEESGTALTETLTQYLAGKRILLLLDNFEHVLEGSGVVGELVAHCPQLQVLVTSRIPLHLAAEREYAVPPLSLPDPAASPDLGALSQYDALLFFVDRARAVKADFALTDENAASVVAICRKLDGLPLAIELAAARSKLFPPTALLQRLDHRLTLLTGGAKDRPTRQQTLRNAIDWSYSLLTEEEQTLFARLSVFAGGCTLEAAEEVCNPEGDLDLLEGIASLVEKSLLRQEGEAEPRFRMLETIREYAAEKQGSQGDGKAIRAAHAASFLRLAENARKTYWGPEQGIWFSRLTMELDNLRAALLWFLERRQLEEELRLAEAIWAVWDYLGRRSEGQRWLEAGLADAQAAIDPVVRSRAVFTLGGLLQRQGDFPRATAYLEESLALDREMGKTDFMAYSLNALGLLADAQGDYARAEALFEESARCCHEAGETALLAHAVHNLGYEATHREEWTRAGEQFDEALALHREAGNQYGMSNALCGLAQVRRKQGHLVHAQRLAEEALALAREVGLTGEVAGALGELGGIVRDQGDYERAVTLLREAEALEREVGEGRCHVWVLDALGRSLLCAGQLDTAETIFTEALQRAQGSGNQQEIGSCRLGLGTVARRQGRKNEAREQLREGLLLARAVRHKELTADLLARVAALVADAGQWAQAVLLLGTGAALYEQVGVVMEPAMHQEREELLTRLRAALDEGVFGRAWQEGRGMSLEGAVDYALEEIASDQRRSS